MAANTETPKLTADYIKDHMIAVHTYDSFGRSISGAVLTQALEQACEGKVVNNEVKVNMEFRVRPTTYGCVEVYTIHGWVHHSGRFPPVVD